MDIIDTINASESLTALRQAEDYAGIATVLQAATEPDHTEYSLGKIGDRLGQILGSTQAGLTAREAFAATLQAAIEAKVAGYASLIVAQQALAAGKLTLWESDRQAVIAALGASWPAETLAAVQLLGVRRPFAGVTAEQIEAECLREDITAIWLAKQAVVEVGIHDGSITTTQHILDAIGGA